MSIIQALPLEDKITRTKMRIREWYEHHCGNIYISFSGGKDSTVLLDIARSMYPDIPAVFIDTGLEYPEVRELALSKQNVTVLRPAMNFKKVLDTYGYPVISKEQAKFIHEIRNTKSELLRDIRLNGKKLPDGRIGTMGMLSKKWRFMINAPFKISSHCCEVMKKRPANLYEKASGRKAITGEMACEGRRRMQIYLASGCNAFQLKHPKSMPLGFWTENDILRYLRDFNIPYASVYGDIAEDENGGLRTTECNRTGCMFCMFGVHMEGKENRFVRMKRTHPQIWSYCINKLGIGAVLDFMGVPYESVFEASE